MKSGELRFDDVSFRYGNAEEDTLSHISFTAKPGQTTAFIGATGAGKSTLINLIPRFYDVTGGAVYLNGKDIRTLSQKELRDNIGYVPQKAMLFSGTIDSNIKYGKEDADVNEVLAALDCAQATEFVSELPNGVESSIAQGGSNVSGGQKQRLAIARALVKKAPVYIFDDSFSALDFKTDAKLRRALTKYTENAVVLIVAQRVSTIMNAEQIIVLDEGKIVGKGTHKELLKTCPEYLRDCGKSAFKGGIGMSEPKRNAPRPHGPGRGMMPTEKAKDFKGSFKKLISYLSPFKFKILIVVIFAALSTVFTIVGPKILAKATDELTAV